MLWIVNCRVEESYIDYDDSDVSEQNHIVEAPSEKNAKLKVEEYYMDKEGPESLFDIRINYCNCIIT